MSGWSSSADTRLHATADDGRDLDSDAPCVGREVRPSDARPCDDVGVRRSTTICRRSEVADVLDQEPQWPDADWLPGSLPELENNLQGDRSVRVSDDASGERR